MVQKQKRKRDLEQEILELKQGSQGDDATSSGELTSSQRKKDFMIANPELLAKLKSMMLSLGKEKEANEKKKESESGGPKPKKSKLLLIDV